MPSNELNDEQITIEYNSVRFLAWLKKRGSRSSLLYCSKKWEREGFDIEEMVRRLGIEHIRIIRNPSKGDRWVILDDLRWADKLMIQYDLEIPHHGQWQELEN